MQSPTLLRQRLRFAVAALLLALPAAGAAGEDRAAPGAAATPAPAADETAASPALHGKGERRGARFDRLIELFQADRRAIYEQYGFPSYRYFELEFETRTEHWFYLTEGKEFVFVGNRLISRN